MIQIKFIDSSAMIEATFNKAGNVVTLKGTIPQNTSGFCTYSQRGALLGEYKEFTTIYRVLSDGVQFSCDGSVWVEPKRDVIVSATWDDADDAEGLRPSEVGIKVNGSDVVLSAEEDWQIVYPDIKESETIAITEAEEVDKYEATISGANVRYYHKYVDPTPSTEEQLDEVMVALCDLDDRVFALESAE